MLFKVLTIILPLLLGFHIASAKTLSVIKHRKPSAHHLIYGKALMAPAPYISHLNSTLYYLAQNLNHKPIEKLKEAVEKLTALELKGRGESHITVLTPPEAKQLFESSKLTAHDIEALAKKLNIQKSKFKPVCMVRGISEDDESKKTYFVVVISKELESLRRAIFKMYLAKGGHKAVTDTFVFYPHITVGFTDTDLHYENGVVKDADSCLYNLKLQL